MQMTSQNMGQKGGQEDGWSPLSPAGRKKERRLLSNSLAASVILCFLFSFFSVCSLNPLIKHHFESVAGVCWVTARPPVTRSLYLFCRFPLSTPSHSSTAGFWRFIIWGYFYFIYDFFKTAHQLCFIPLLRQIRGLLIGNNELVTI